MPSHTEFNILGLKDDPDTYQKALTATGHSIQQIMAAGHYLEIMQAELQDEYAHLFSLLTGLPPEYVSQRKAWAHLLKKVTPPLVDDNISLEKHMENCQIVHELMQSESNIPRQFYPTVVPGKNAKKDNVLTKDMLERAKLIKQLERFLSENTLTSDDEAASKLKEATEGIELETILSPIIVVLFTSLTGIFERCAKRYQTTHATSFNCEQESRYKQDFKKKLTMFLEALGIPAARRKSLFELWDKPGAILNTNPQFLAQFRISYLRAAKVTPEEFAAFLTLSNFNALVAGINKARDEKRMKPIALANFTASDISEGVKTLKSSEKFPKMLVGTEFAFTHISKEAVLLEALHKRVMEHLVEHGHKYFSLPLPAEDLPEKHPLFSPLFESLEASQEAIKDISEGFGHLEADPNYDLLRTFGNHSASSDKEAFVKTIREALTSYISAHILPKITPAKLEWRQGLKTLPKVSLEAYDRARQIILYLSSFQGLHQDQPTWNSIYGSPTKPALRRSTHTSSMPKWLMDLLYNDKTMDPLLRAQVVSVIHKTASTMFSRSGRENLIGLNLTPMYDKHGQFLTRDDLFQNAPAGANLTVLRGILYANAVRKATQDFLETDVIPPSTLGLEPSRAPMPEPQEQLVSFLSTAIAIPKHLLPPNSELHHMTAKLARDSFFSQKPAGYYDTLHEAYRKQAKLLIHSTFVNLDEETRNCFIFLLRTVPVEAILSAIEELLPLYRKLETPKLKRDDTGKRPKADRLEQIRKTLKPLLQILLAPSSSAFSTRAGSKRIWDERDDGLSFFKGVQDFICKVREDKELAEFLSKDDAATLLLTINILETSGVETELGNKNIRYVTSICHPIYAAVIAELGDLPYQQYEEPKTEIVRDLLILTFQKPHHITQHSNEFNALYPVLQALWPAIRAGHEVCMPSSTELYVRADDFLRRLFDKHSQDEPGIWAEEEGLPLSSGGPLEESGVKFWPLQAITQVIQSVIGVPSGPGDSTPREGSEYGNYSTLVSTLTPTAPLEKLSLKFTGNVSPAAASPAPGVRSPLIRRKHISPPTKLAYAGSKLTQSAGADAPAF